MMIALLDELNSGQYSLHNYWNTKHTRDAILSHGKKLGMAWDGMGWHGPELGNPVKKNK